MWTTDQVMRVLIPDLMPLHEWMGYESESAYEAGDTKQQRDELAPDNHQIVEAIKAGMRVNRFDLVGQIKELLGPKVIQMALGPRIATFLAEALDETMTSAGALSENGFSQNGESDQTSSSTPPPIAASSAAGPSPA